MNRFCMHLIDNLFLSELDCYYSCRVSQYWHISVHGLMLIHLPIGGLILLNQLLDKASQQYLLL